MQVENTQEDFEIVSTIAIYPWRPLSIRRNFMPHKHLGEHRWMSAVGRNGLYFISENSAMGMVEARKITRGFC